MTTESDRLNRIADQNRRADEVLAALERIEKLSNRVEVQAEIIAVWSPLIDRLEAKLAEVERQRDLALEGEREKACERDAAWRGLEAAVESLEEAGKRVAELEAALRDVVQNAEGVRLPFKGGLWSAIQNARAALSSPPPHDGDAFVRQRPGAFPRPKWLPGDPEEKCLDCGHRRSQHFTGCGGKPELGDTCPCAGFAWAASTRGGGEP